MPTLRHSTLRLPKLQLPDLRLQYHPRNIVQKAILRSLEGRSDTSSRSGSPLVFEALLHTAYSITASYRAHDRSLYAYA